MTNVIPVRRNPKDSYPEPTFKKLKLAQSIAIHGMLTAHLLKDETGAVIKDETGAVSYEPGWDDERIGEAAIPEYPGRRQQAVGAVRVKLFGSIRKAAEPRSKIDRGLLARIEVIEAWLKHLGADLNKFPG